MIEGIVPDWPTWLIVVVSIFVFIWILLWFFLPFMVYSIQSSLTRIKAEIIEMNKRQANE